MTKGSTTKRTRSPSHPAFDLRTAIEKAQQFYTNEQLNYAPVDVAKSHWGYKPRSSSGLRALAAMLHFGLFEEIGSGKTKRIRLSETGKTIVLHPEQDSKERMDALKLAALHPTIYRRLWKEFGPNLPSNKSLAYDLETKKGFNHDSLSSFIKNFRATIEFANLKESATLSEDDGDEVAPDSGTEDPKPGLSDIFQKMFPKKDPRMTTTETRPHTIPLTGGRMALLEAPVDLSPRDFGLLNRYLGMLKDASVEDDETLDDGAMPEEEG